MITRQLQLVEPMVDERRLVVGFQHVLVAPRLAAEQRELAGQPAAHVQPLKRLARPLPE